LSRVSTFSYSRNAIDLAVAYASTIRTHLSVHGTAQPMSAASVHPRSAADCLIRSAVDISHSCQQGLTSLILVQARLLPAILSVVSLSMSLVQVQSGGWQSFVVPWQGNWHCSQLCFLCFYPFVTGSRSLPADAKPSKVL